MIVCDVQGFDPLGVVKRFVVMLEVNSERYVLETAVTGDGARKLVDKWGQHATALCCPIRVTTTARRYAGLPPESVKA